MLSDVVPSVQTRGKNYVEITYPTPKVNPRLQFSGHRTLNGAFSAPQVMFEVPSGGSFRSPTIRKKRLGIVPDSSRGVTRVIYDPMDFFDPSNPAISNLPEDDNMLFMRVAEFSTALGGFMPAGPIVMVPPAGLYAVRNPTLTVFGTAPNVATAAAGESPVQGMMNFHLPMYSTSISLTNHSNANPILVSFVTGLPLMRVEPSSQVGLTSAQQTEVFISAVGGTADFSLMLALVNGL